MRRSEFRPVYFALLILVILGGYFGVKILTSTDSPSPDSEQNLAQFELPTSRGGLWTSNPVPTKVVVINFWASWCGPCRAGMPHIRDLQREYGDDVRFIGVTRESENVVTEFLASKARAEAFDISDCGAQAPNVSQGNGRKRLGSEPPHQ